MIEILAVTCNGRRMGVTITGRVGIFPAATQIGDAVVAFFGGEVPYILRAITPENDIYHFIGECYVDGIMDGEVISTDEDSRIVFHLV